MRVRSFSAARRATSARAAASSHVGPDDAEEAAHRQRRPAETVRRHVQSTLGVPRRDQARQRTVATTRERRRQRDARSGRRTTPRSAPRCRRRTTNASCVREAASRRRVSATQRRVQRPERAAGCRPSRAAARRGSRRRTATTIDVPDDRGRHRASGRCTPVDRLAEVDEPERREDAAAASPAPHVPRRRRRASAAGRRARPGCTVGHAWRPRLARVRPARCRAGTPTIGERAARRRVHTAITTHAFDPPRVAAAEADVAGLHQPVRRQQLAEAVRARRRR